ncbi:MAG: folate family ECF transporter S component [Clostridia bacterium]
MSSTKKIAYMAMMVTLGICLNMISFSSVQFFGRVSLVYGFCYIVGIMFGPILGACVAMLADILPAVLFPQGPWMPLITISLGMMALIVGVCYKFLNWKIQYRLLLGVVIAFFVCTLCLTPLGETPLFYMYPYTLAKSIGAGLNIKSPYIMLALAKAITQPMWIALNYCITLYLFARLKPLLKMHFNINPY